MSQNGYGLYSSGRGDSGQLGLGSGVESNENKPTLCAGLQNLIQIACGGNHCAIVAASGELFTFGNNDYGQLGRSRRLGEATKVEGNPRQIITLI